LKPYLYTKKQIERIFFLWRMDVKPPTKGKRVVVCFPKNGEYDFSQAEIEWLESPKSTYGERLYQLTFSKSDIR